MVQVNCCGRIIKNRTIYQLVIAVTFLTILAVVVPTLALLNNSNGRAKTQNYLHGSVDPMTVPADWDGVVIWANISAITTSKLSIGVRYSFYPGGKYATAIGQGLSVFSDEVTFRSGGKKVKFDGDDILRGAEVKYPIALGDPNQYPFDQYLSEFVIAMIDKDKNPIPISLGIVGAVQSWQTYSYVSDLNDGVIGMTIQAQRGGLVKFFSIFVLFNMWVLSLTILTLSSTIWFRERKVEPPIISLCASLMFALPAVRNTQPDTPPIGCTADVGGFFFNMAIVAVSAFLAMLNYIVNYKREKPKEPAPAAPADSKPPAGKDQVEVVVEEKTALLSKDVTDTATIGDNHSLMETDKNK